MNTAAFTALVADDDPGSRRLLTAVLDREGGRVLHVGDPAAALAAGADHEGPIHLLVTDLQMAGMTGWELAERFRAARPETAVLYVSGSWQPPHPGRSEVMDPSAFLLKPFRRSILLDRVRALLEGRSRPAQAS